MRLYNLFRMKFEVFRDEQQRPPYIILSHRWGRRELSYQQVRQGGLLKGSGARKLAEFLDIVRERHAGEINHVWMDTCCIDQLNPADVDEAIRSMFRYYTGAKQCYVYLADVYHEPERSTLEERLIGSSWFSRGWTLQELVAPSSVVFFDLRWNVIGHKCSLGCPCTASMNHFRDGPNINMTLEIFTGIGVDYLSGRNDLSEASIACKMSWAAFRQTKRPEDMAYCLQGLFGITVQTRYGEGRAAAFSRLQRELMANSTDQSILAWTAPRKGPDWPKAYLYMHKLISSSPLNFMDSAAVSKSAIGTGIILYTVKNYGIKLRAFAQRTTYRLRSCTLSVFIVQLGCVRPVNVDKKGLVTTDEPVEIALTDGTANLEPTDQLYYRLFANDLGSSLGRQFPPSERSHWREHVFRVSLDQDNILGPSKL